MTPLTHIIQLSPQQRPHGPIGWLVGGAIFLALIFLLSSCSISQYQGSGEQLYIGIKSIEISDEDKSSHGQRAIEAIEEQLAYAPNNAIFGSSIYRWPWPSMGLWLYKKYEADSTFMGRWMRRLGSKPIWVSDVAPDLRAKVSERILREYGYLNAEVRARIIPRRADSLQAKVAYEVRMGSPYLLDSVAYLPPIDLEDSLVYDHQRYSRLHRGGYFGVDVLEGDRTEVSANLREHGFYYFKPSYIAYEADTLQHSGRVQLRSSLVSGLPEEAKQRWRIGQVRIHFVDSYGQRGRDSLELSPRLKAYYRGRLPIRRGVLANRLHLKPDSLYRQSLEGSSLKALGALGTFSSVDISFTPAAALPQTSLFAQEHTGGAATPLITYGHGDRVMDMNVLLRSDLPWDASVQAHFTTKTNDLVGPGGKISLDKRNVFGGGETFTAALFGSYEWQTNSSNALGKASEVSINSYQLGANVGLTLPTLLFPGRLDRYHLYPTSTTLSLSAQMINRSGFYSLGSVGLNLSYDFQPNATQTHSIRVLDLSYNRLRSSTAEFREMLVYNPSLGLSMRDQLVPQIGYSFVYDNATLRPGRSNLLIGASVSQAGNLTSGLFALLGRKSFDETKHILGVPFAQFVKLSGQARHSWQLDRRTKLVSRLLLGGIYSYGNMLRAPYMEQFYVGGANSLRAFRVRSLGPGRFSALDNQSPYAFMDHVGEFKLETNIEWRKQLTGLLDVALFVDAGNVWLLRPDPLRPGGALSEVSSVGDFLDQIAVGTGGGIRLDFSYLVVRLDIGVGLHLPYKTSRSGWYNIPKFGDALGFHLAVGYPF